MKLFNNKTLDRHLRHVATPPEEHLTALQDWAELISSGRIKQIKETALSGDFKTKIIEDVLGYTSPVGNNDYTVESEQKILRGSVDLALGHFTQKKVDIVAPFELKGAKTKDLDAIMPGRNKSPVQQAWEYATNNVGTKWVLVSNYLEIRLYGFGEGTQAYEHFDMARLHEPQEYARFILLLSADNLLSGKTADLLKESRREDKDITDALYADYKALRSTLIDGIRSIMPSIDPLESIATAQTVLDRVLFIAFAEDTGLLPKNILEQAYESEDKFNPRPVWDNFKGLFNAIDKGSSALGVPKYNGGLFAPDATIDALALSDDICERFKKIGDYDFASEISVTVLGHIFEQSIADVERLQAIARGEDVEEEKAKGTSGRRKRDGVVYTPDYIARFIVEQTVGTHIREIFDATMQSFAKKGADVSDYENIPWKRKSAELEAWRAYRDRLTKLRIVDPACGSGVFLVMAFDFMKAELNRVNEKVNALEGKHQPDFFDPDSEILTNNLFGVDVNSESVEIAKLSLWIKTARRGKVLDSLDDNILVGDSLIEDSNYAYLSHPFTWQTAFPDIFAEGGFDIVLGNPPYVRQELLMPLKPYLSKRFDVYQGSADLFCYFFERGLRLLKDDGRMGYICSRTYLKTNSGKPLRKHLLVHASLEHVIDFDDEQVFEGVTTYTAITTMRKGRPSNDQTISYWNVDELPNANFRATYHANRKLFPQTALSESSWGFENDALRALKAKISEGKSTLRGTYEKPFRGVTTGRNEAFVVDQELRDELVAKDPSSSDILLPWVEGKDLERWYPENRRQWIIFARQGLDLNGYPAILEYLAGYREQLEPKPNDWKPSRPDEKWPGRKSGTYSWSEIQDKTAYWEKFSSEKIVSTKISSGPTFSVDRSGSVLSNTAYLIDANSDNEFVTSLLNSNVASYYFKSTFVTKAGGFFEIQPEGLSTFPIPIANTEQKTALSTLAQTAQTRAEARYTLQDALRRRIPDLCPPQHTPKLSTKLKEWWLLPDFAAFRAEVRKCFKEDIPLSERNEWEAWINRDRTEIARLTAEISKCEAEINALVYTLFDLTTDEIKLLEANI